MIYEYICEECKNVEAVDMRMKDEHPKIVVCSKCGKDCYRNFLTSSIVIPENMRATTDNEIRYDKSNQLHSQKYF